MIIDGSLMRVTPIPLSSPKNAPRRMLISTHKRTFWSFPFIICTDRIDVSDMMEPADRSMPEPVRTTMV